jgi:hypothetical protein
MNLNRVLWPQFESKKSVAYFHKFKNFKTIIIISKTKCKWIYTKLFSKNTTVSKRAWKNKYKWYKSKNKHWKMPWKALNCLITRNDSWKSCKMYLIRQTCCNTKTCDSKNNIFTLNTFFRLKIERFFLCQ